MNEKEHERDITFTLPLKKYARLAALAVNGFAHKIKNEIHEDEKDFNEDGRLIQDFIKYVPDKYIGNMLNAKQEVLHAQRKDRVQTMQGNQRLPHSLRMD